MDTEGQLVKELLRQNEFLLRRHLVLSKTVLDQLKTNGLITEIARRKIMLEPSHRQIGVLVRTMEYKGLNSMKKFLDVLRATGHSWLVENLLDTDLSVARMQNTQNSTSDGPRYRDQRQLLQQAQPINPVARPGTGLEYRRAVRTSYDLDRHQPRTRSLTSAVSSYLGDSKGVSLGSLLKAREARDVDPMLQARGSFNTRTLLTDPTVHQQPLYPDMYSHHHGNAVNPASIGHPMAKDDIPSTLFGLNQAFADQDQKNEHSLNVLRQEEMAIRQLMEQNARDQGKVRRNKEVVQDIVHRLRDIHVRANEVYKPTPHPNIGRYRLSQLNQIPWSIDR